MTILGTAIMKAIMMLIEMKAEEEEIAMIMKIQGEEQKGREAEAGAGTMDQGEANQGAEGQNTLQLSPLILQAWKVTENITKNKNPIEE